MKLDQRKSLLAQVHIAKKQLNLQDDEYRALLQKICGVDSSSKATDRSLRLFLEHCRKCGWQSHGAKRRVELSRSGKKIYSLWQQLHQANLVQDRSYQALESWIKAQTGVDKLTWLNGHQESQAIEQLKRWLDRAAPAPAQAAPQRATHLRAVNGG